MLCNIYLYNNGAGLFDANNKLTGPSLPAYQVRLSRGLVQTLRGVSATIGGAARSSTQVSRAFAPSVATYRDLKSDGTWSFTETAVDAAAPPVSAGALRVGVCVTSAVNVIQDTLLCPHFWSLQQTEQPSLEAARAVGNQIASQQAAQVGGTWTAVVVAA